MDIESCLPMDLTMWWISSITFEQLQIGSLVGGLKHFDFFHISVIIIPIDCHIFQRGRYTTNQIHRLIIHRLSIDYPYTNQIRLESSIWTAHMPSCPGSSRVKIVGPKLPPSLSMMIYAIIAWKNDRVCWLFCPTSSHQLFYKSWQTLTSRAFQAKLLVNRHES